MNIIRKRITSLRKGFAALEIDGFLVTNPTNIRWLSGFTGTYSRLLITENKAILGTDSRYWIQARREAPDYSLFKDKRRQEDIETLLKQGKVNRVGFESNHVTVTEAEGLNNIGGITWISMNTVIEERRQFKNDLEIAKIHAAAAITDEAMAMVPELVRTGISERDLAWQLEKIMRESGADGLAFPIIVAFGPNSALPHHHPGDRTLNEEENVLVDMGAELNGYKSDMTRSFYYGHKNDRFQEIYDLVLAAQNNALLGMRDGVKSNKVHELAMDVIADGGYGEHFPHGLGHGIGLDIHEMPFLSLIRTPSTLEAGMAITVEPGVYIEGWGGVRIEDLVTITNNGLLILSKCPKNPYIRT